MDPNSTRVDFQRDLKNLREQLLAIQKECCNRLKTAVGRLFRDNNFSLQKEGWNFFEHAFDKWKNRATDVGRSDER